MRNLALRAADAAKNTAGLIEGTVKKVKGGSDLVQKTNEAFTEVAESTAKVGTLVSEIAVGSNEQAQGIAEVNTAMGEMDQVVQAAASGTEELSAQSEELNGSVGVLLEITEGESGAGKRKTAVHHAQSKKHAALPAPAKKDKAANPEQVIPLDDKDFDDF